MHDHNKEILTGLKKAQTHLSNVINMLETHQYCIEILQQNLAVIGLLKSANNKLLQGHLNTCFSTTMKSTNETRKQKMIDEILSISKLINK